MSENSTLILIKLNAYLNKLAITPWCDGEINTDGDLKLKINKEKKKKASELDGCYVIHTDLKKEDVSKEIVHSKYKDLALVETAFRTLKTGCLEIRPLFVRKESRTRGHVFVSMLAYMVVHSFWRSVKPLGHSLNHAIDLIQSIQTVRVQLAQNEVTRIPDLAAVKKDILKALDVKLPEII